jgi:hypothetical protein
VAPLDKKAEWEEELKSFFLGQSEYDPVAARAAPVGPVDQGVGLDDWDHLQNVPIGRT